MSPQPQEVSGSHRTTLEHIFAHPLSYNVEWHDVVSLLREVAPVNELRDGKLEVAAGDRTFVLERPRDKDIDAEELMEVRHVLESLGYGSEFG